MSIAARDRLSSGGSALPLLDEEQPRVDSVRTGSGAAASSASSSAELRTGAASCGPAEARPSGGKGSTSAVQLKVLPPRPPSSSPPMQPSDPSLTKPAVHPAVQLDSLGGSTRPPAQPRIVHVKRIDAFALKEKPSTMLGGVITVLVVLAIAAYTAYTVASWLNRPWTNNSTSQWTYRNGPWALRLRCRAASGCWLSNQLSQQWAETTSPPSESKCTFLAAGDWATLSMVFSNSPNEGLAAIFIPNPSNASILPPGSLPVTKVPSNFGLEIESSIACAAAAEGCVEGAQTLLTPIAGGLSLLFLVETTNNSAAGLGAFRREWYPTQVTNLKNSADTAVVDTATTCNTSMFDARWVHARVRLTAEFAQVVVERDALWLVLWGTVGGALSLFMQVGGIVLALVSIVMQRAAAARGARQVRDEEQG